MQFVSISYTRGVSVLCLQREKIDLNLTIATWTTEHRSHGRKFSDTHILMCSIFKNRGEKNSDTPINRFVDDGKKNYQFNSYNICNSLRLLFLCVPQTGCFSFSWILVLQKKKWRESLEFVNLKKSGGGLLSSKECYLIIWIIWILNYLLDFFLLNLCCISIWVSCIAKVLELVSQGISYYTWTLGRVNCCCCIFIEVWMSFCCFVRNRSKIFVFFFLHFFF